MAVNVKVNPTDQIGVDIGADSVHVNVTPPDVSVKIHKPIVSRFKLEARETLSGDILIFDHKDIDIIIIKEKKKVVAFAKDLMNEAVYGAENRLMTFLRQKGIIQYDSIQGGNVYGSLEGQIIESQKLNSIRTAMHSIAEWISEEAPAMEEIEDYDQMMDDYLTEPTGEDSTRLGKVPQKAEKGSIDTRGNFSPYYYQSNFMYESLDKPSEDK